MKRVLFLLFLLPPKVFCADTHSSVDLVGSQFYAEIGLGTSCMYSDAQGSTLYSPNYNPQVAYPDTAGPVVYGYSVANMGNAWGNLSPLAALRVGFDWRLPESSILLGLYVNGGISGAHAANLYSKLQVIINAAISAADYAYVRETGFIGAGLRFGLAATKRTVFYSTVGWSIRNTSVRFGGMTTYLPAPVAPGGNIVSAQINNQLVYRTVQGWVNCLVAGLGVDVHLTPNWALGLLCEVNIGNRHTFSYGNQTFTFATGNYDNLSLKIRPTISQAMVTFKYTLPIQEKRCPPPPSCTPALLSPPCPVPCEVPALMGDPVPPIPSVVEEN